MPCNPNEGEYGRSHSRTNLSEEKCSKAYSSRFVSARLYNLIDAHAIPEHIDPERPGFEREALGQKSELPGFCGWYPTGLEDSRTWHDSLLVSAFTCTTLNERRRSERTAAGLPRQRDEFV